MECDIRNAMTGTSQSRNWLEDEGDENDKVFRWIWEKNGRQSRQSQNGRRRRRKNNKKRKCRERRRKNLEMVEEIVPRKFHKLFEKKKSERMLIRKTWDHAIDLRKDLVPKKKKICPLLRIEREKVQEFVKDQLRKRYIWLSKSVQKSLVFFVLKKDGKERMAYVRIMNSGLCFILFYFPFLFLGSRVRVSVMSHITVTPSYNYELW